MDKSSLTSNESIPNKSFGLVLESSKDHVYLKPFGDWVIKNIDDLEMSIKVFFTQNQDKSFKAISLKNLTKIDASGIVLLNRLKKKYQVNYIDVKKDFSQFIKTVENIDEEEVEYKKYNRSTAELFELIGKETSRKLEEVKHIALFTGLVLSRIYYNLRHISQFRFKSFVHHIEAIGFDAIPLIVMLNFVIGVVLAYMGATQLEKFGAQIYTLNIVAIGVLKELGVMLTSILIAGRSGSAFTAQISTMRVNEEVDALRVMSLNPIDILVVPRIMAIVFILPIMIVIGDIIGLIGGGVMVMMTLGYSAAQIYIQFQEIVTYWTFLVGFIKAPIFALIIGIVGCYEGLNSKLNAESIGRATTRSVVKSIFLIMGFDAFFAIYFSMLGV